MRQCLQRFLARLRGCDRGAVMVEFVAVLPFLLMFLFAVAEIGRALWYHHVITKGVRDGVRYLSRVAYTEEARSQATNLAMCGRRNDCPLNELFLPMIWNDAGTISFDIRFIDNSDGELRGPEEIPIVIMTADVPIDFWLLNFFGMEPIVTLQARDEQRWIGG